MTNSPFAIAANFRRNLSVKFCCVLIIFGSILVSGCGTEYAKWEFARGLMAEESGDFSEAIARMKAATAQAPADIGLKLELARALAEQGDDESLVLCDEVLAEFPNRKSAIWSKAICQQHLGDFVGALATYKRILADHVKLDKTELNNLAYFRALANRELYLAANDIELAIDKEEANRWPSGLYLPLRTKAAMANGLVSRYLNRQADALDLLSNQIQDLERDYANFQAIISLTVFAQIQDEFPLAAKTEQDSELLRNNQDLIRGSLVSLLVVRALVFQDLGRQQAANADRLRIRELGYDADRLAENLPGKFACLDLLNNATTYLDTRGYVLGLLPWNRILSKKSEPRDSLTRVSSYQESLADLDMAVRAAETIRFAIDGSLYNMPELSVADVKQTYRDIKRIEAVLRCHRAGVHQRAGRLERAELDRQAIQALGFEPGCKSILNRNDAAIARTADWQRPTVAARGHDRRVGSEQLFGRSV